MTFPLDQLSGFKPLAYLGDGLVLSSKYSIYTSNLALGDLKYICSLDKFGFIRKQCLRSRLLQRLLRLELGPSIPLPNCSCVLICSGRDVYKVDISTGTVLAESLPPSFSKPLQMLCLRSSAYEGLVFCGDYSSNQNFGPVNIYRRDLSGDWSIAYVFPSGEINHIHGIFEDTELHCLYILTGDFNQAACVWVSDFDFTDVRPLSRSGQISRACWIRRLGEQLFYATDQQESHNYLCSINPPLDRSVEQLFPIVGSSIYHSDTHSDPIVFSTTVEPFYVDNISLGALFSRRRAPGIISDYSCIYYGSPSSGFQILFKAKKDFLPFRLFQFGSILFPSGFSSDNRFIHFYCTALSGCDGKTFMILLP